MHTCTHGERERTHILFLYSGVVGTNPWIVHHTCAGLALHIETTSQATRRKLWLEQPKRWKRSLPLHGLNYSLSEEESVIGGGNMSLLSKEESISEGISISGAHRVKVLRQSDLVHIAAFHFSRCSRCHLSTHSKALMLRRLWAPWRLQSAHAWRMSLRLVCVS